MGSFFARARRWQWPPAPPRTLFLAVALAPAVVQLVCFVYALAARAAYPMDLEWLEGTQLCEALRFARGLPVYGPPAQGFVPSPYPPLYHLVVSVVGRCFGFDYWNGRVVSDAAIVVAVAVQTAVVLRAAPSPRVGRVLAVLGAAGVAASYRPLQASMDLARVDMLGFAIVAVAACVSRSRAVGWGRAAALGALLCAAVYTKQTNVFYALWILGALALRQPRHAALASAIATAIGVAALVYLQRASGGWFWTWMTTMRHHGLVAERCVFWGALVLAAGAALRSVLAAFRRRGWLRDPTLFWCGMLAASVPACVLPMLSGGGWVNNLIGLTLLALLVALLLVCDALRALPGPSAERWIVAVLSALLLGALYDPGANVPDSARRKDVDALHATVRSLRGDVLTPMYPFVAVRDGKSTPQMSLVAYDDTAHPGDVNADPSAPLRSTRADWVVLFGHAQEDDVPRWLGPRYVGHPVDLRVQALTETTGRGMTLFERQ
ncbi:MAG TPA: hypothetical protein VGG39_19200 [Polyangiaceae bacterium]|jgi:hypothetical protein